MFDPLRQLFVRPHLPHHHPPNLRLTTKKKRDSVLVKMRFGSNENFVLLDSVNWKRRKKKPNVLKSNIKLGGKPL